MNTTTRRVQLKRVFALTRGDRVRSSLGVFSRQGTRLAARTSIRIEASREGDWTVVGPAELDSSGMLVVTLSRGDVTVTLWTPADAYVALAS